MKHTMKEDRTRVLNRQIERVLDQGSGARRQVIVRTALPGEETDRRQALLAIASDALKQRNMALSARECLPPALSNRRRSTVKDSTPGSNAMPSTR